MKDAARRALEDFAVAAIERLVERDGPSRFFCEFCSSAKPITEHAATCPVRSIEPLLRDHGKRIHDATLPLDPPPPMAATGTVLKERNDVPCFPFEKKRLTR